MSMRILILGGSSFVGLHIATAAIAAGCQVTLFNRGKTNPLLLPGAEHLIGDRDGDLHALKEKQWDVVIDVCGYLPRLVRDSAQLLRENVSRYIFISSCSVYDVSITPTNADEGAPVLSLDDQANETITDKSYGGLKALCEREVTQLFGDRALILRLGLVSGPQEKFAERLYWIRRVALGGDVLVPMENDEYFNFIDVRDVAAFSLLAAKHSLSGVYNLAGQSAMTLRSWLQACRYAAGSSASFVYVDDHDFLDQSGVYDCIPFSVCTEFLRFCSDKALKAGLQYRGMEETAFDMLAWNNSLAPEERELMGLSLARELQLLEILQNKKEHFE